MVRCYNITQNYLGSSVYQRRSLWKGWCRYWMSDREIKKN